MRPAVVGEMEGEGMEGEGLEGYEHVVGAVMGALANAGVIPHPHHGHHRHHHHHRQMALPPRPQWRNGQIAPGVHAPDEGLELMPMAPSANGGIFTSTVTAISWTARPQRPFRGERLITAVTKNGTTAAAVQWQGTTLFIGTEPQQLQIAAFNLEIFQANAFGVRFKMSPAEPGIDIILPTLLTGPLTSPDNVVTSVQILGSSVR